MQYNILQYRCKLLVFLQNLFWKHINSPQLRPRLKKIENFYWTAYVAVVKSYFVRLFFFFIKHQNIDHNPNIRSWLSISVILLIEYILPIVILLVRVFFNINKFLVVELYCQKICKWYFVLNEEEWYEILII